MTKLKPFLINSVTFLVVFLISIQFLRRIEIMPLDRISQVSAMSQLMLFVLSFNILTFLLYFIFTSLSRNLFFGQNFFSLWISGVSGSILAYTVMMRILPLKGIPYSFGQGYYGDTVFIINMSLGKDELNIGYPPLYSRFIEILSILLDKPNELTMKPALIWSSVFVGIFTWVIYNLVFKPKLANTLFLSNLFFFDTIDGSYKSLSLFIFPVILFLFARFKDYVLFFKNQMIHVAISLFIGTLIGLSFISYQGPIMWGSLGIVLGVIFYSLNLFRYLKWRWTLINFFSVFVGFSIISMEYLIKLVIRFRTFGIGNGDNYFHPGATDTNPLRYSIFSQGYDLPFRKPMPFIGDLGLTVLLVGFIFSIFIILKKDSLYHEFLKLLFYSIIGSIILKLFIAGRQFSTQKVDLWPRADYFTTYFFMLISIVGLVEIATYFQRKYKLEEFVYFGVIFLISIYYGLYILDNILYFYMPFEGNESGQAHIRFISDGFKYVPWKVQ